MVRSFIFSAIVFVFIGCATGQSKKVAHSDKANIFQHLGAEIDSLPNSSGQLMLYVQKVNLTARYPLVKAIVIDVSSHKIVTEFSYTPGYCKWKSETEIEVFNAPGTIQKDEDISKHITIIKVKSNKATP